MFGRGEHGADSIGIQIDAREAGRSTSRTRFGNSHGDPANTTALARGMCDGHQQPPRMASGLHAVKFRASYCALAVPRFAIFRKAE